MKIDEPDTPYLYPGDYSVDMSEDSNSSEEEAPQQSNEAPPGITHDTVAFLTHSVGLGRSKAKARSAETKARCRVTLSGQ